MDLHALMKYCGGTLALLMYVPLITGVIRTNGAGQSFAMWGLWAVLDTIITISLIVQGGNFWLTAGFAAGSVVLSFLLLAKGRFAWGRLETGVLLLVLGCLVIWIFSGPKIATVATTAAILIAGLPGLIELWRNPQPSVARVWVGFTVANVLAFVGGAGWSIEERFAPGCFSVWTIVLVCVGCRPVRPSIPRGESGNVPVNRP